MAKRVRRTWPLVLGWAIALVVIGGVVALQANITPLYWAIRTCALLGYLGVFLSVVSSAYLRPLVRYFGRPFVQTHHALSVTSLVLITLHPLAVALSFGSLNVFVPILNSWIEFLRWGGARCLVPLGHRRAGSTAARQVSPAVASGPHAQLSGFFPGDRPCQPARHGLSIRHPQGPGHRHGRRRGRHPDPEAASAQAASEKAIDRSNRNVASRAYDVIRAAKDSGSAAGLASRTSPASIC